MKPIRWMLLFGFLVFAIGALFLSSGGNTRVGFGICITGFSLVFVGVVAGNLIASFDEGDRRVGRIHRIALGGFCLATLGIGLEFVSELGAAVMILGLCLMFGGVVLGVLRIRNDGPVDK